jgi:hypothetical protein
MSDRVATEPNPNDLDDDLLVRILCEDPLLSSIYIDVSERAEDIWRTDDICQLAEALRYNVTVKSLFLYNCQLTVVSARAIGVMLESNCGLDYLGLNCNFTINADGIREIMRGLWSNTSLLHIGLPDSLQGCQMVISLIC